MNPVWWINEVHIKGYPFKKLFSIHVRGKNYQSNKKIPRLELLKIRPKSGHSKVHNYLFIKFFVEFFSIHFFPIMYHILNPYKKILRWNHNKKCIWMLMQVLNYNPYVHFKSPLLHDWCMFIEFFPLINILIQVGNINP
jgi:hypothetical protein